MFLIPEPFLKQNIDRIITIITKQGKQIKGTLKGLDSFMAIRLTNPLIDNVLSLDYELTIKQRNVD